MLFTPQFLNSMGTVAPMRADAFDAVKVTPWRAGSACLVAPASGYLQMMTFCGKLFVVRTELALNLLEFTTRARAFDQTAAILHQFVRFETILPIWLI